MRVQCRRFPVPLLVLILLVLGAGCRRPKRSLDLTCDRSASDSAGQVWSVHPRPGSTTDSVLHAHGRGRIVIRAFARSDSSPVADTLTAGLTGGPNPTATFQHGEHGVANFEIPAGFYVAATRCPRCPRTAFPHTVAAGRVDTLDLYLERTRSGCDLAITRTLPLSVGMTELAR